MIRGQRRHDFRAMPARTNNNDQSVAVMLCLHPVCTWPATCQYAGMIPGRSFLKWTMAEQSCTSRRMT
eukprot:5980497-Amphidinium_carterae.2